MRRSPPETRHRARPTCAQRSCARPSFRVPMLACVVAIVLLPAPRGRAAEFHELHTDRDAFTPATTTVDAGQRLLEASYAWIDNRGTPATNSFPELLLRLGLTERLELRLGANYEQGSGGSVVSAVEVGEGLIGEELESESNVLYGLKLLLTGQERWVPRSSVIVEGFTPTSGDVWGTEPCATYVFGWELPEEWRFDAAVRYVYADSTEGRFDKWVPSAVLRIPMTDRWEVHAEWFGAWTAGLVDDTVRPFVGPGTHFMLTPAFEIGCRVGWGLSRDAAAFYVDSGIGWRF